MTNIRPFRMWIAGVVILLAASGVSFAQQKLLRALDYSQFRYDSVSTLVELYTSISPSRLWFHKAVEEEGPDSSQLVSTVKLEYQMKNINTDSAYQISSEIPVRMPDTSSIALASRIVSVIRLLSDSGRYHLTAIAVDGRTGTPLDTLQRDLVINAFPDSQLAVSGVELCSGITHAASKADPYYKNTLHVVPNPEDTYGLGMPVVSYYAEIYGLRTRGDSTEYNVTWHVIDTYGRIVKQHSSVETGLSPDVVEVGSDNISNLPSGRYALEIFVADSVARSSASASKYFFVYNPYVKQPEIASNVSVHVLSSPFLQMGLKELNDVFYAANYLETPQQTDEFKKLSSVDGKRRFLADFWAREDRKAGLGGFNSWEKFYERFNYANKKYKTAFKKGWLTDRGRVYIDYGAPDQIDRHPNSSSSKPYEIWTYNSIEGGVIFVFVDLTGFNDYILIHSTKQGEVSDPDWQKYVQLQQQ